MSTLSLSYIGGDSVSSSSFWFHHKLTKLPFTPSISSFYEPSLHIRVLLLLTSLTDGEWSHHFEPMLHRHRRRWNLPAIRRISRPRRTRPLLLLHTTGRHRSSSVAFLYAGDSSPIRTYPRNDHFPIDLRRVGQRESVNSSLRFCFVGLGLYVQLSLRVRELW